MLAQDRHGFIDDGVEVGILILLSATFGEAFPVAGNHGKFEPRRDKAPSRSVQGVEVFIGHVRSLGAG